MARPKRGRAGSPEAGTEGVDPAEAPPAKVLRRSARVRSIAEAAETKATAAATAAAAAPVVMEEPAEELRPSPQQPQSNAVAVVKQELNSQPEAEAQTAAAAAAPSLKFKNEPATKQPPPSVEEDDQDMDAEEASEPESKSELQDSEPSDEEEEEEEEEPPPPKKPARGQQGRKAAQAKKAAKPKKEKKKKTPTRRICLSVAMARYGLSRKEMDALTDVQLEPNPHHARGAPMRLYLQHQCEELARKKQERQRYEEEHAEEIAAAKEEAVRQRREAAKQAAQQRAKEAKQAATARVAPLRRQSIGDSVPAGATPLPQELWAVVFQRLAATLEPQGGLRGPGVVAADIVRAGLACRDMFIASRAGLEALAEEVEPKRHMDPQRPPMPQAAAGSVDWARWDKTLRTPLDCTVPDLKAACKEVATTVGGTKAELVVRLMDHFGLPDGRRCPVPARLWVALRQEHGTYVHGHQHTCSGALTPLLGSALRDLSEAGEAAAAGALGFVSLCAFRRRMVAAYGDTAGLMAAHRACLPRLGEIRAERARRAEEDRRRAEERRRQQYEQWRIEAEARRARPQTAANGQSTCACGNMVSAACSMGLCGGCCRRAGKTAPCPKHG
ncbi:hypothetical protein HYH02_014517 [Chlamydomonas schloesseri]|uniref:SAP domain-containing protein n=1 Tax=Chlamydomonas schloesseri TaxID=2026947 RepID=A0A835VU46_9CHLO|nr:hypothetical protein HYH02_014517 [Chlamydomonas schloesseri]|eukprot:KAG2427915.1 hypothetical protein HYH02_014517 [Chlamydomonas schloesseri]